MKPSRDFRSVAFGDNAPFFLFILFLVIFVLQLQSAAFSLGEGVSHFLFQVQLYISAMLSLQKQEEVEVELLKSKIFDAFFKMAYLMLVLWLRYWMANMLLYVEIKGGNFLNTLIILSSNFIYFIFEFLNKFVYAQVLKQNYRVVLLWYICYNFSAYLSNLAVTFFRLWQLNSYLYLIFNVYFLYVYIVI